MDENKKILLGEKDILSKSNEDLFININLNSNFSELRNNKFENVFDVSKQFDKERNASRDFRIYGIIDSTVIDCDNLTLYAYSATTSGTGINSGVTVVSGGLIKSFSSTSLVYNGYNAFNKKRGKYLLELTGYTNEFVYIQIPSNNFSFKDQVYAQQLIFTDADGNFVDYGTQTIDIDSDGNAININNDFYFLYNKHWIKKDLLISEEKHAVVFMSGSSLIDVVPETTGISTTFQVVLNKPSPFGLEKVDLEIVSRTLDLPSEIILQDSSFNTIASFPITLSFAPGEQIKNFYFFSPIDFVQELTENVIFDLTNFQFVDTGSPLNHQIQVIDSTPKNLVTFDFQNIYQNRNYFDGRENFIFGQYRSNPWPSVLRNGLNFDASPIEFYPIDNFTLKITNNGSTSLVPTNPFLGIVSDTVFPAGQQLQFDITTQYQNVEKHSVKFYFSNFNSTNNLGVPLLIGHASGVTINGIPIVDYSKAYKVDYEKFLACLKNTSVLSTPFWPYAGQNISGWNRYNLDIPFDVIEDLTGLTITIVAKNPGTRLDVQSFHGMPDLFDISNPLLQTLGITAQTIQGFVQSAQTPLQIILGANLNNNSQAQYVFEISKKGYSTTTFTTSPLNASTTATTYFLSSAYNNMLRNWDDTLNRPIYIHSGVTTGAQSLIGTIVSPAGTPGFYNVGDAYVNGVLLLSNYYFADTSNTNLYLPGNQILNQTSIGNQAGTFVADFFPNPLNVVPETSEYISTTSTNQEGYLLIGNASSFTARTFDFSTGSSSSITYSFSSTYPATQIWNYVPAKNTSLSNTQYPNPNPLNVHFATQGLSGSTPVSMLELFSIHTMSDDLLQFNVANTMIKITSLTTGNPFFLSNFTGENMRYIESVPNEILGLTINHANNFMGGYLLTNSGITSAAPIIRKINFDQSSYPISVGNQAVVKITLDAPSVLGNESVIVNLNTGGAPSTTFTAAETYPKTLTWAIGDKDKFLTFTDTYPRFGALPIYVLNLSFSGLTNLNPGAQITSDVVLV